MDTKKPFEKLAAQFQISHESAKYFLGRVQKSFKTERPSHALILEFIQAQKFAVPPTPYEVASMMYESGAWVFALNSAPPIIIDDEE
jgi:hypothetical protein